MLSLLLTYWTSSVQIIPRWRYDLEKPAHIALATLGLLALAALVGHSLYAYPAALTIAAIYFGLGKVLVAVGLIAHGSHKSLRQEACRWVNELGLCLFAPTLIHGGLALPVAALASYVVAVAAERYVVSRGW